MIKRMKRSTISIIFITVASAIGLSFGLAQQEKKDESTKPLWERPMPEDLRQEFLRDVQEMPDIPEKEHLLRRLQMTTVEIWQEELEASTPKRRARALQEATPEVLSAETAIPAIVPLLEDESARVRFEAAVALLRFGNDQGIGVLLELLKEPAGILCWDLVLALLRCKHKKKEVVPVARELFEKALRELADGQESGAACSISSLSKLLAGFEDRESYPLFERYFGLRPASQMRPADALVVEEAARLGEPHLGGKFQEIFDQSKELRVKLAAAFGLAKLGDQAALRFLMNYAGMLRGAPEYQLFQDDSTGQAHRVSNPAYERWSKGKPPLVELIAAVTYVGELRAAQAFPLLEKLALTIENQEALRDVIKALVMHGDKRAVGVLIKLTKPNHPLRFVAAKALLYFDDPEGERVFRALYTDEQDRAKLVREAKQQGPRGFSGY